MFRCLLKPMANGIFKLLIQLHVPSGSIWLGLNYKIKGFLYPLPVGWILPQAAPILGFLFIRSTTCNSTVIL